MYKAKSSNIKQLIKWGKEDKVVKHLIDSGAQPSLFYIAFYSPSQANWSYQIGIANVDGRLYELVTRFGSVEGGRELTPPLYGTDGSYNISGK